MAKVDLDKLDTELKRWRGEIPLPCDIVESMADELRALRVAAPNPAPKSKLLVVGG